MKIVKLDPKKAMKEFKSDSVAAADSRFEHADKVTNAYPSGLSPKIDDTQVLSSIDVIHASTATELAGIAVGSIATIPLNLIDLNPYGARHYYTPESVARITETIGLAQDVAAHGYIQDGRVKLIDGGTRYRAAQNAGKQTLDVKIEVAPKSNIDLFQRSRELNDRRSDPSVLDFSLGLKKLLDDKEVVDQNDLLQKVPGLNGKPMAQATLSKCIRIAKMPSEVRQKMAEAPVTTAFNALYAVSTVFQEADGAEPEPETVQMALEIVDEIKRKDLSKSQILALVQSRMNGRKHRERSVAVPLDIGGYKGQIKMFGKKGRIELSLVGLDERQLPVVKNTLIAALEALPKTA